VSLPQNQREGLFTANKKLLDFLPPDDPMVVFGREIYPAFKDEDFARYYSSKGRCPIRFESTKDSGYRLLEDWFNSLRREVFHGRITQKDQLLVQGYEVTRHPLNSCEILIGPDAMLFLKPFSDK
jgi:hypothetical protein